MRRHRVLPFFICIGTLFCVSTYADDESLGNVGGGAAPLSETDQEILKNAPWEAFQSPTSEKKIVDDNGVKWTVFEDALGNKWAVSENGKVNILNSAPRPQTPAQQEASSGTVDDPFKKKKEQSNASSKDNDALDRQDEMSKQDVKTKP